MFNFMKRPRESSTITAEAIQGVRFCAACGAEFVNSNHAVCPSDRTMLLTRVPPDGDPFEEIRLIDAKYCPTCKRLYRKTKETTCRRDGAQLSSYEESKERNIVLDNRYELVSFLNAERMFKSYAARDLNDNNKIVAIKLLSLATMEPTRFIEISKTVTGLRHANIISLYAINEFKGLPYMVCDYVIANPLSLEIMNRGVIDSISISKIIADALEGLQHAHVNGITHSAINADNIYVSGSIGKQSRGLLANFGAIEMLFGNVEWNAVSTDTHTGNVYGEAKGFAPEFCKGTRPTPQSDVYQTGCVLYEALTGKPPFERVGTMPTIMAHLNEEQEEIDKFQQGVPEDLKQIVYKCLKKEPKDRFQSANSLRDNLLKIVQQAR